MGWGTIEPHPSIEIREPKMEQSKTTAKDWRAHDINTMKHLQAFPFNGFILLCMALISYCCLLFGGCKAWLIIIFAPCTCIVVKQARLCIFWWFSRTPAALAIRFFVFALVENFTFSKAAPSLKGSQFAHWRNLFGFTYHKAIIRQLNNSRSASAILTSLERAMSAITLTVTFGHQY